MSEPFYVVHPALVELVQQQILDRLTEKLAALARQRELRSLERRAAQDAELREAGSREVSRPTAVAPWDTAPLRPPDLDVDEVRDALRQRLRKLKQDHGAKWQTYAIGNLLGHLEIAIRAANFRGDKFKEIDERIAALER